MTTAIAAQSTTVKTSQALGDFGEGRYSPLMAESFKQAKAVLKLSEAAADKLARQIASDVGAAMRGVQVTVKAKVTGKDNKVTLREAALLKNVTRTNAINVMLALNWTSEAMKHNVSFGGTKWVLVDALDEYLADLEKP